MEASSSQRSSQANRGPAQTSDEAPLLTPRGGVEVIPTRDAIKVAEEGAPSHSYLKWVFIAGVTTIVALAAISIIAKMDPSLFAHRTHDVMVGTAIGATLEGTLLLTAGVVLKCLLKKDSEELEILDEEIKRSLEREDKFQKETTTFKQAKPQTQPIEDKEDWDARLRIAKGDTPYYNLAANKTENTVPIAEKCFHEQYIRLPYLGQYSPDADMAPTRAEMAVRLPPEQLTQFPIEVQEAVEGKNVELLFMVFHDEDQNLQRNILLHPVYMSGRTEELKNVQVGVYNPTGLQSFPIGTLGNYTSPEIKSAIPLNRLESRTLHFHNDRSWSPNNNIVTFENREVVDFYLVSEQGGKAIITHMVVLRYVRGGEGNSIFRSLEESSVENFLKKLPQNEDSNLAMRIRKEFTYNDASLS